MPGVNQFIGLLSRGVQSASGGQGRRLRRLAAAAGVLLCGVPSLPALDREDLLFHAALDGRLQADYARGKAAPQRLPAVDYAAGIKGQGVVALPAIAWDGPGNIMGDEGTLSFWFAPVDWASGDGKSHNFVFLDAANGSVRLYLYYPGNLGMLMQSGQGTRTCWTTRARIEKGEFTQVTFAWRPGEWSLYLDGLPMQKETDPVVPFGAITGIRLGDGNTIFDELLILRRAVTEEEAKALYYRIATPAKRK